MQKALSITTLWGAAFSAVFSAALSFAHATSPVCTNPARTLFNPQFNEQIYRLGRDSAQRLSQSESTAILEEIKADFSRELAQKRNHENADLVELGERKLQALQFDYARANQSFASNDQVASRLIMGALLQHSSQWRPFFTYLIGHEVFHTIGPNGLFFHQRFTTNPQHATRFPITPYQDHYPFVAELNQLPAQFRLDVQCFQTGRALVESEYAEQIERRDRLEALCQSYRCAGSDPGFFGVATCPGGNSDYCTNEDRMELTRLNRVLDEVLPPARISEQPYDGGTQSISQFTHRFHCGKRQSEEALADYMSVKRLVSSISGISGANAETVQTLVKQIAALMAARSASEPTPEENHRAHPTGIQRINDIIFRIPEVRQAFGCTP